MLDDDAIARYARQIVVPGIGAAGQEKLLASTVLILGDERGCRQAALYLRAAGVRVLQGKDSDNEADLVLVADAFTLDETTGRALAGRGKPICWYVADECGFTNGVHPAAHLPSTRRNDGVSTPCGSTPIHDAAACDAASIACAILIGLDWRSGPFRFEI